MQPGLVALLSLVFVVEPCSLPDQTHSKSKQLRCESSFTDPGSWENQRVHDWHQSQTLSTTEIADTLTSPLHILTCGVKFQICNSGRGRGGIANGFFQSLHSGKFSGNLGHLSSHDLGLGTFPVLLLRRVPLYTYNPRT